MWYRILMAGSELGAQSDKFTKPIQTLPKPHSSNLVPNETDSKTSATAMSIVFFVFVADSNQPQPMVS